MLFPWVNNLFEHNAKFIVTVRADRCKSLRASEFGHPSIIDHSSLQVWIIDIYYLAPMAGPMQYHVDGFSVNGCIGLHAYALRRSSRVLCSAELYNKQLQHIQSSSLIFLPTSWIVAMAAVLMSLVCSTGSGTRLELSRTFLALGARKNRSGTHKTIFCLILLMLHGNSQSSAWICQAK